MPLKSTIIKFPTALILTLIFVGVFIFMFNKLKKENEHASKLSQTLNDHLSEDEGVSSISKVIAEANTKRDMLTSYIVDENQIDKFVTWVEETGDSVKVPIVVSNVSSSPSKKNIISISLKGRGSFSDVVRFVSLVEYSPYQLRRQVTTCGLTLMYVS